MATIEYKIIGDSNFLRDAEYSFYIYNFLKEFEDKFLLAENIIIHFEDSINSDPNKCYPNVLSVSNGGKSIKLTYKSSRFFLPKGGMSKPSVSGFFSGLRFYLENTVIAEDNKRAEELDTDRE